MPQAAQNPPAVIFDQLPLREQLARRGIISNAEKQQLRDRARYAKQKQERQQTLLTARGRS